VDSSVNKPIVLYIKENEEANKSEKKPKSKIFKITPKHLPKKFIETVEKNSPFSVIKKTNGKHPLNNYPTDNFLVTSRDRIAHHEMIRKKIFKINEKELARVTPQKIMSNEDPEDVKNNPRYWFLENSISEIPMSYRIAKTDSSLTPYAHSHLKSSSKAPMKDTLRRRVWMSQNKTRPMSNTFYQVARPPTQTCVPIIPSPNKPLEVLGLNLPAEEPMFIRRERRAETAVGQVERQSIKLRADLNDMAALKLHMSPGKLEAEYNITPIILGSGSYAVVKLGEEVGDSEKKVAIKIYEKKKLYTNKMRRKNLVNEIVILKNCDHKNIGKIHFKQLNSLN
jgi:hypothetical protein